MQKPYVISRYVHFLASLLNLLTRDSTHLQIVEDLEIMNFALFNESHHALKSHGVSMTCQLDFYAHSRNKCGRISEEFKGFPHHHIWGPENLQDTNYITTCQRDYLSTGILETLFELGIPLGNGSNRTEWAYAPYMEAIKGGLGPKVRPLHSYYTCHDVKYP